MRVFSDEGGIFNAAPGSKRRLIAVQSLLTGASRTRPSTGSEEEHLDDLQTDIGFVERLMSSSVLERAFAMLMDDYQALMNRDGGAQPDTILPKDIDRRVVRRLIRTISRSGDVKLARMLGELIKHVKICDETDEYPFPQPMEGIHLLEYYLGLEDGAGLEALDSSPSTISSSSKMPLNVHTAFYILEEMIVSDPETMSNTLVDTASQEGHRYSSHLTSQGISATKAYHQGLIYTLRNIVINILLKKSRFNMLHDRLKLLADDVKETAAELSIQDTASFYTRPVRTSINLALVSKVAFPQAFAIAGRFPEVWSTDLGLEGSGTLLRALCDCAIREGKEQEFIPILQDVLGITRPPPDQLASAAVFVGGEAIVSIINHQARIHRGDIVSSFLKSLRIINEGGSIKDDAVDQLFPPPIRADLITAVAKAGLKVQSRALYERWAAPLDYTVDSNMVQGHIKKVVQTSISKQKPVGHQSNAASSEDFSASVKQSSKCLQQLVRLFAGRSADRTFKVTTSELSEDGSLDLDGSLTPNKQVQFAYHVLFNFLDSKTSINVLNRKQLVRLASAYKHLDQRAASFKCLGDIMHREENPTVEEALELLRLLSRISLEKTVQLLLERVDYWIKGDSQLEGFQNKENLSRLYSPLLGNCLFRQKSELAQKLLRSAKDNGLSDLVSMRAMNGLVKYAFEQQSVGFANSSRFSAGRNDSKVDDDEGGPDTNDRGGEILKLAKWFKTLMEKDNWRPDPAIISWLIQNAIAGGPNRGVESKFGTKRYKQYTHLNSRREAAILMLCLSAKHLGYVDYSMVAGVLRSIQQKAYIVSNKGYEASGRRASSMELQRLTHEIDTVVKVARWVQVLGKSSLDTDLGEEEIYTAAPSGQAATKPNQPDVSLFRFLIVSYLRVGDITGAANIMTWVREEAKLSFEDLEHGWKGETKGFRNYLKDIAYQTGKGAKAEKAPRDILGMLAGTIPVGRTKSWWNRSDDFV
jgi:hypothetical protein